MPMTLGLLPWPWLGRPVKLTDRGAAVKWLTVVGIVDNVRRNSMTRPTIYQPILQAPERGLTLLIRVRASLGGYVSSVCAIIRRLDSTVAVAGVASFDHEVSDSIEIIRIIGVFGVVRVATFRCRSSSSEALHSARARLAFAWPLAPVPGICGDSFLGMP